MFEIINSIYDLWNHTAHYNWYLCKFVKKYGIPYHRTFLLFITFGVIYHLIDKIILLSNFVLFYVSCGICFLFVAYKLANTASYNQKLPHSKLYDTIFFKTSEQGDFSRFVIICFLYLLWIISYLLFIIGRMVFPKKSFLWGNELARKRLFEVILITLYWMLGGYLLCVWIVFCN